MADSTRAKYTFLPFVRQGLAAAVSARRTPQADADGRLALPVRLRVNTSRDGAATDAPDDIAVPLKLYGPGDIAGIDQREVVRTEPRNLTADFEPNYFPAIEFDRPDFPWMFTPAHADDAGRLRPWLCLVVVRRSSGVSLTSDSTRPLAVLECPRAELPDLTDSWAWAHAQIARAPLEDAAEEDVRAEIERVIGGVPKQNVSRLICPRRLDPNTPYYACLVPTFEAGRLAGLGQPVTPESLSGLLAAWAAPAASNRNDLITLPVYYHWQFSTGGGGDNFETLVRRLDRRGELPGVGTRRLDVSDPGWSMPRLPRNAPGAVLDITGALVASQSSQQPEWPAAAREGFAQRLREILNAPATRPHADPLVAPPIYGQWHAGRGVVSAAGEKPHWLRELNLDPRYRAAAGLGTLVVRYQQEELMASAWEQVEEVERANQLRRQAQLAREVGGNIHERLKSLAPDLLLQVTEPAHADVTTDAATAAASQATLSASRAGDAMTRQLAAASAGDAATIEEELAQSALPETVLSTAFRRLVRRRGPLARRLAPRAGQVNPESKSQTPGKSAGRADGQAELRPVRRLSENPTAAAPPRAPEAGMISFDKFSAAIRTAVLAPQTKSAGAVASSPETNAVEGLLLKAAQAAKPRADFAVAAPTDAPPVKSQASASATAPAGDGDRMATLFRDAAITHQKQLLKTAGGLNTATPHAPPPRPAGLAEELLTKLNPSLTVSAALRAGLQPEPSRAQNSRAAALSQHALVAPAKSAATATMEAASVPARPDVDPLTEVMSAPVFPQPMYQPLRDFHDMLLPGLENVPPNTVSLLKTNPRFIEAYMVGLNHEMSRELLWREYPTDRRGTYFRQFWDVRTSTQPEPDIAPLHTWKDETHLGENFMRDPSAATRPAPEEQLVLLIRGDLLRRYPNAIIYAVKAAPNGAFPEAGATEVKYPLFRGVREPDVTFIGFALTEAQARGTAATNDAEAGWFFVLQEQPTEPRFGLDPATEFGLAPAALDSWRNLSWGHLAPGQTALEAITYVNLAGPLQGKSIPAGGTQRGVTWGANSGHMARITLQRAYRVAIHASAMLPRSQTT